MSQPKPILLPFRQFWTKKECEEFLRKKYNDPLDYDDLLNYQFEKFYKMKGPLTATTKKLEYEIVNHCKKKGVSVTGPRVTGARVTGARVTGVSVTGASEEATRSLAESIDKAFYGPITDIKGYTLDQLNDFVNGRINYNLDFPNDANCQRLVKELKQKVQEMILLFNDYKQRFDTNFNLEIINDLIKAANKTMEYIRTQEQPKGDAGCHINKGATDFLKYWDEFLGVTETKYQTKSKALKEEREAEFWEEVDRSVVTRPKGGKTKRHKKAGKRKTNKKRAKAKTHKRKGHKRKGHNNKSKKLTRKH